LLAWQWALIARGAESRGIQASQEKNDALNQRAVFMTHSGLIPQDAVFARALSGHRGLDSIAVVHGRHDRSAAASQQAFGRIVDIAQSFDPSSALSNLQANLGFLADFESRGGESTVLQDVYQDRWLLGRFDLPFIAAYLVHGIRVLGEILDDSVVVVVGELTMALYRCARRLALGQAPYLFPLGARFFPHFYFEDSLGMRWRQCRATYSKYMKEGVPDQYAAIAEAKLASIVNDHAPHTGFGQLRKHPALGMEPLHEKMRWARIQSHVSYWGTDFSERNRNPRILTSPWQMSPPAMISRWVAQRSSARYLGAASKAALSYEGDYCTFFLHYQPEYTVEGVGFPVVDQVGLVRTIAQCLPPHMRLIVKEQPWMVGSRPRDLYAKLKQLPNVLIAGQDHNSRHLISTSACVFSISGTAALEALFFGTPSVLFSDVFHSAFEGVETVFNLYELPDRMRELLRGEVANTHASSIAALAAIYSESYPGSLTSLIADEAVTFSRDNVQRLGEAILMEFDKRDL